MSDLASELRKVIEFENPDVQGSEFHDLVINQSVCHTHRDEPAWMYAIKDAVVGAKYESARLRPVLLAMVEAIEGLEQILHEGNLATQGNWDATDAMKQTAYGTLARLREIVGMK